MLTFTSVADWPPLAWLVRCDARTRAISVRHGPRVETTKDWFCEAAWEGDYEAGDFDRTDIVAGTGARVRGDAVTFVPSGSPDDRIHSFEARDGVVWVSNSLPCLLTAIRGELDPTDSAPRRVLSSIQHGLRKYERWLQTSVGPVRITYFDNLRWSEGTLTVVPKPFGDRTFSDFTSYRGFLERSLAAIIANAGSTKRRHAFRPLGTLSSGYDSTTVTVLAREAGLQEVISFAKAFTGPSLGEADEDDSGAAVARILGLTCHTIASYEPAPLEEVPIFAANGYGEDMHYLAATPHLAGRLVFSGNRGDLTWGKDATGLASKVVSSGFTGPGLTEFRLWVGFLHAPVPYWGSRALEAINAISNSEEMKPWDVPGPYSRPICRRIIEGAGVPRGMFARSKRWSARFPLNRRTFLSAASLEHYLAWVREHRRRWLRARRFPPPTSLRLDRLILRSARRFERLMTRASWSVADRFGWPAFPHYPVVRRLCTLGPPNAPRHPWLPPLRRYLLPWALSVATTRYATTAIPEDGTRA